MRNSWIGKDVVWTMNINQAQQHNSTTKPVSTGYAQQPLIQQPLQLRARPANNPSFVSEEEYFKKKAGPTGPRAKRPTEHMNQTFLSKR